MYKVDIYASRESFEKLKKFLVESKLYWYSHATEFRGRGETVVVSLYLPDELVGRFLEKASQALDLRKREDAIYISRVEGGSALQYRVLLRRIPHLRGAKASRPLEELEEEARGYSRVSGIHVLLATIASVIALAGMIEGNLVVMIGAMVISPIMGPIYALALGISLGKLDLALKSLFGLCCLVLAALASSALAALALLSLGVAPIGELVGVAKPGAVLLVLALLLGAAISLGGLSRVNEAFIGVAVAAAIIPPAAAAGASIVVGQLGAAESALAALAMSLVGLVAGSLISMKLLLPPKRK